MVKTLLSKFRAQQKLVQLQVFNCSLTKKWAHSLVFFNDFAYFLKNIYFKEYFSLTASVCIMVQDWYIFHDIIFYGLHFSLFSCHKISTLAFRSMFIIYPSEHYHDQVKIRQWPVFTWPMWSFTPSCVEKIGYHFSGFFTKQLSNRGFFLYWKTWGKY